MSGESVKRLSANDPLLSVRSLSVEFGGGEGAFRAVKDVSFDVQAGKDPRRRRRIGLRQIRDVTRHHATDGLHGRADQQRRSPVPRPRTAKRSISRKPPMRQLRSIRGNEIAMIFQEPMTSLNPVFTVGNQIAETLTLHEGLNAREALAARQYLLQKVRLPDAETLLDRYPHQLSGGMRQRVMIAMALACNPKLLIADEPTTALDVTIQAQILNIIRDLQQEMGTAVIFITHDMGVVAEMADDVVVMWKGEKVEEAPVREIFAATETSLHTRAAFRRSAPRQHDRPALAEADASDRDRRRRAQGVGETHVQDTADYAKPLLEVDKLTTRFDVGKTFFGRVTHRVHAVEEVSFDIYPGETLALVGESGSGKSTIGRTLQQLIEPTGGTVRFDGRDMGSMSPAERRRLKQEIQYIFQDPFASLDPRHTIGFSIAEPIVVHNLLEDRKAIDRACRNCSSRSGCLPQHAKRYPHEFSGGQRQRVCIARALASNPKLIIADESVSALDVSIQAQIINLLMELQQRRQLSYLFITHDMAVVEKISHRVAVMYLGQIVEIGTPAGGIRESAAFLHAQAAGGRADRRSSTRARRRG